MDSKRTGQIIDVCLFLASYFGLFIIWNLVVNALLVPWDATAPQDQPPLGSTARSINDYFESASIGADLPYMLLFGISFLIVLVRIKKKGLAQVFPVLQHTAITNLLYMMILVAMTFASALLVPPSGEIGYSPVAITVNVVGVIVLFVMQYTGSTLHEKSTIKSQL